MSAWFAPSASPLLGRTHGSSELSAGSGPVRASAGLAALRWLAAGVIVAVLAAGWLYISATVDAYATHLCDWPATISCDASSAWSLVTIGFGVTATVGVLTVLTWATTNRGGLVAAAYPLWIVAFPMLVHLTGPRRFDQSDLVVLGGFAGLAIELLRQSAMMWMPTRRQQWMTAAISSAVVYAVLLSLVPTYLSNLAS